MNRTPYYTSLITLVLTIVFLNPLIAQTAYEDFPWLNDVVNTADCCQNETVTAYQSGIFTFIYIEKGADCTDEGSELYFQDGTFYCLDINGMDCRAAYGLTESNATLLWDCEAQMGNVFSICLGDSVFLPAIQDFPVPPLPPAGPNGEIVFPDCQPQLFAIEISPTENSVANGLNGFYVTPTETTFYEITSIGTCGGPDATNSDERIIAYEVIVEKNCITEKEICDDIFAQAWASDLTEEECTGNIYNITYNGQPAIYMTTLCDCLDDSDVIFDCKGSILCFPRGFLGDNCEADIADQLTTENLLWAPECDCPCPIALSSVCGADGQMYESACEATCAGVEILDNEACAEDAICPALEKLSVNPDFCNSCMGEIAIYLYQGEEYLVTIEDNPICSDGITTVTNCDSTAAFCFDGGIAGFSQCNDFFKEAELKEVIWSRNKDCDVPTLSIAPPCTDLTGVDFGLCLAIMGVGLVDDKCQTISGCLDYVVKGVDYSAAFFPTVEICLQECGPATEENVPEIFNTYQWLADVVDSEDCKGSSVEVYDLGSFSFVHVQTEESGELYFEDGSFYCLDLPNYDCRALYNLTEKELVETWTCDDGGSTGPSGPSSPIGGGLIRNLPTNTLTPSMSAYPNPTNGNITIDLTNRIEEEHIVRVFDLFGRLIEEKVVNAERTNVDLSAQDAGIYLIETFDGTNRMVQKIIKQ